MYGVAAFCKNVFPLRNTRQYIAEQIQAFLPEKRINFLPMLL
nr:MAG TPA: hypothetical protein [Caudoviricetes sp.]